LMCIVEVGDVFVLDIACIFLSRRQILCAPSSFVMGLIRKKIEPFLMRTVG
jgi:hypothetical protein